MTREEAITLIDELQVCIKEHPIIADWLVEIADRKTEPSNSEKPNNCEECKHWSDTEDGCADRHGCKTTEDCSTVPTSSILEQVDEPRYEMGMGTLKCDNCSEYGSFKCSKCDGEMYFKRLEPKDEPQTEREGE